MSAVLTAPHPRTARLRRGDPVPAPVERREGVERDEEGRLWLLPTHEDEVPSGYFASAMHPARLSDGALRLLRFEAPAASVFAEDDDDDDIYREARLQAERQEAQQQAEETAQRRRVERSYRRRRAGLWVAGGSLAVVGLLLTPPAQDVISDTYKQVVEVEKAPTFTVPAELLDKN